MAIESDPHLNFWRVLYGGLTNLAVIDWCKLFGAHGSNKLHWRNIYAHSQSEFRQGLLEATGLNEEQYKEYWREMKHWRDTNFAHIDIESFNAKKWPHFDLALLAADFYYSTAEAELCEYDFYFFPKTLNRYREIFGHEVSQPAKLALQATSSLPASKG